VVLDRFIVQWFIVPWFIVVVIKVVQRLLMIVVISSIVFFITSEAAVGVRIRGRVVVRVESCLLMNNWKWGVDLLRGRNLRGLIIRSERLMLRCSWGIVVHL